MSSPQMVMVDPSSLATVLTLDTSSTPHHAAFAPADSNMLAIAVNGGVELWDLRAAALAGRPALEVALPSFSAPKGYDAAYKTQAALGVDIDVSGLAGLLVGYPRWRLGCPLTCIADSHSDEQPVFHARFLPGSSTQLITAGDDGLICLFDAADGSWDEDDSLVGVLSQGESSHSIGFFGPSSEFLWTITGTYNMVLWSLEDVESILTTSSMREDLGVATLVSASYDRASEQLVAFGADPVGNVVAAHVTLDAIEPVFTLSGGHAGHIRAVHWNSTIGNAYTAAEDGLIRALRPAFFLRRRLFITLRLSRRIARRIASCSLVLPQGPC
ncbi:uncharacterized protein AMSG_11592 [Thecamonas trahens ATCC 50062]|uniref:Uncharacterized protein n=1 Tax=Thecamonas trahens ATCC 50062 TaxID=461836 RepID=A0A0L0D0P9_THETB|nr:hypothetical protein AMSG_11592 [Thecamonas trahens ATCC 50062]KNC45949.1 hypothetical protein AMSG_11592 [Thecamonas trahens ATCC 50062]|eukprot:XP_013763190.1 hypothetical protein AMSG_11592 [Thecamonas trahens ATCC 50062]